MRQLALDFATQPPRYGRETFLAGPSNRSALAVIDAFAGSPEPALAITGPAASGKTHLAHILAAAAGVSVRDGFSVADSPVREGAFIVLDNIDARAAPPDLLVFIETCRERGAKIALAGQGEPRSWAKGLIDLETRLAAMVRADLKEPDEELLRAVLLKGFEDKRLRVPAAVIDYAAPRMPRTFAAARAFIELSERELLETAGNISIPLARKVLGNLSEAVSPS
ncbi:MAG: hypothetical protein VX640_14180 [Pseudomonadota bacterium]|nr:hypothetical protein [Pseudomonadota bacterium]